MRSLNQPYKYFSYNICEASPGGSQANLDKPLARFYSVSKQISVMTENLVATSARIQDVDVADEAVEIAKFNS
ncbi:MAG TPA: hypothetical protein DHV39_18225 [Verrucomicrobiales bacterium]|nr:hypothetical protein [Verrucomicrobiales bacterium]